MNLLYRLSRTNRRESDKLRWNSWQKNEITLHTLLHAVPNTIKTGSDCLLTHVFRRVKGHNR